MKALRHLAHRLYGLLLVLWILVLPLSPSASAQEAGLPDARMSLAVPLEVPLDWATVRGRSVEAHGLREDDALLRNLVRHGDQRLSELAGELRVPTGGTIHIYLAPSKAAFHALQGGRIPDYADGTAWPIQGRIFLHRPADRAGNTRPVEQVLDHELVHVLLGRAFAPAHPPRWFQEGVAQVIADETDPEATRRLVSQLWLRNPFQFAQLDRGFPSDAASARIAYAQSADLVRFLQQRHGDQVLPRLVRELARNPHMGVAIPRATGESLPDLEAAWRDSLDPGVPRWILALGDQDLWWFSMGLLAAVSLIIARRRGRKRMSDYARDERRRDAIINALMGRSVRQD